MNNFFKITPNKRSVKIHKSTGVIYHNPSRWKKIVFNIGSAIFVLSFFGLFYLYQPLVKSWLNYKHIDQSKITYTNNILISPTVSPKTIDKKPEILLNNFDISIPKIGAESKVVTNVSPIDRNEYIKILNENVIAHSNLSSLPNQGVGTMTYLFAHSSQQNITSVRNNSVFYLLGELNEGDIFFINYKGSNFTYKVYMKKIITTQESEYLNYTDSEKEIVILQTCWPIGTNWKRLLVFAERI